MAVFGTCSIKLHTSSLCPYRNKARAKAGLHIHKSGFMGHNNDAVTFRLKQNISPNAELEFSRNTYLPLVMYFSAAQITRRPFNMRARYRRLNRQMAKRRNVTEHVIRNVKLFRVLETLYGHPRRKIIMTIELCAGFAHCRAMVLAALGVYSNWCIVEKLTSTQNVAYMLLCSVFRIFKSNKACFMSIN